MKRLIAGFLAVALVFVAEATELVWKGASGAKWSAAASWTPEQAPATGGMLVIPTGVTLRCRQVYLNGVRQSKCEFTSADGWIEGGGKLQTRRGVAFVIR